MKKKTLSGDRSVVQSRSRENKFHIYIVISYSNTVVGRLIRGRAKLKFWNRYDGDCYSHVSLSLDSRLTDMMSFARKKLHNPLISGLIREDIHTGVFSFHPDQNQMAVFALPVTYEQYQGIRKRMEMDWARREQLKYNFLGLFAMLLTGRGAARKNHYFCSHWAAEILSENGFDLCIKKKPYNIRHFDLYTALQDYMIYEGKIVDYPLYNSVSAEDKKYARTNYTSCIL